MVGKMGFDHGNVVLLPLRFVKFTGGKWTLIGQLSSWLTRKPRWRCAARGYACCAAAQGAPLIFLHGASGHVGWLPVF